MKNKSAQMPIVKVLLASAIASVLMAIFRVFWSHQLTYLFLIWNLFLAWIPFLFVHTLPENTNQISGKIVLTLCMWLLFFPNSPYIITDLIHLKQTRNIPLWFDASLLMSFAWNGLLIGFLSLFKIHKVVSVNLKPNLSWLLVASLLTLSSFGVYLGRFERWNSWDLITNPFQLFDNIFKLILHPFRNKQAVGVTIVFSIFLITSYTSLFYISKYHHNDTEF